MRAFKIASFEILHPNDFTKHFSYFDAAYSKKNLRENREDIQIQIGIGLIVESF